MTYDYIIIGAGMGGITAGLEFANNHKKVLILEKNSLPGGCVTTFKKGRFEFDLSLYDLYDYGSLDKKGDIRKLFSDYNIDIETEVVPFNARVKDLTTGDDFRVKGNIDEFFVELEKLKSGSADSLKEFLRVIKEINEAVETLKKGHEDLSDYPKFLKYLDSTVIDALTDLKMPRETIYRLCFMWVYLGSPLDKLSFIDFAVFMYRLVFKKRAILKNKNIDMALKMINRYQDLGGKIYYHSKVVEIADNGLSNKIVKTSDGKEYKCREVICNVSKRYAYTNLIKIEDKDVNRLENARTLAPNGVMVYLGLNKDCSSLGLKYYHYYQFQNLYSTTAIKNMANLYHGTIDAVVPNVVNEFASPKNTTILVLKTTYFDDVFQKLRYDNHIDIKEKIANDLIEQFENTFNIDIKEFIEEIEVITPLNLVNYTGAPNGSIMGYMRKSYDNAIHRLISYEDEKIDNIHFVGGSSIFGAGVHNAIYSGYFIASKILESEVNDGE